MHEKFTEVENSLVKFQDAEWPPKGEVTPPEWMSLDKDTNTHTSETETEDTLSQLSESQLTNSMVEDTTAPFDDTDTTDKIANGGIIDNENTDKKCENKKTAVQPTYDDIISLELVASPVNITIQLLCKVIDHPQKTAKMYEMALDCINDLVTNGYISGQTGLKDNVDSSLIKMPTEKKENSESEDEPLSFLQYLVNHVIKCSESNVDVVQMAVSKTLLALMTCPKCGIHEASMLTVVRAVFHVYLVSKSESAKSVSRSTLLDMLRSVFSRMEAYSTMLKAIQNNYQKSNGDSLQSVGTPKPPSRPIEVTEESVNDEFASQFHKDGFLLFRALCKLSTKSLPDDNKPTSSMTINTPKILQSFSSSADPLAMQSKILSLEIILFIFENCGEAFRKGERFIYAVQQYLCASLLKNCMSSHTNVTYISLKIFLALVSISHNFIAFKQIILFLLQSC